MATSYDGTTVSERSMYRARRMADAFSHLNQQDADTLLRFIDHALQHDHQADRLLLEGWLDGRFEIVVTCGVVVFAAARVSPDEPIH